jgi:hypothetical protein
MVGKTPRVNVDQNNAEVADSLTVARNGYITPDIVYN